MRNKINRIGETKYNKWNSKMTIKKYNSCDDIIVQFDNGFKTNSTYSYFKKGNIKSPYDKTIYNIGYIGEGDFKVSVNGIHTLEYKHWFSMMTRCYNTKLKEHRPTYINCSVCEEWLNFQNFAQWHHENYYEINNEVMCLDKDILHKGNKIYSPDNCVFVPERINTLFCRRQNNRGDCLIGVTYQKRDNMFQARCNDESNKSKYLGYFNTEIEAFNVYKKYKEQVIKIIADMYKNIIPITLYKALYNYKVELVD